MTIQQVVFDVGNVLVRWDPHAAIGLVFPEYDPVDFFERMKPIWHALNVGKMTLEEATMLYHHELGVPYDRMAQLMQTLQTSQSPIDGSLELLETLKNRGVPIYALTDNIREFMHHHQVHSHFLSYLDGCVVSAEVGALKPDPKMYQTLLHQYQLQANACVFIDDMKQNVEGARAVGMHAFQFRDAASCRHQLIQLGLLEEGV